MLRIALMGALASILCLSACGDPNDSQPASSEEFNYSAEGEPIEYAFSSSQESAEFQVALADGNGNVGSTRTRKGDAIPDYRSNRKIIKEGSIDFSSPDLVRTREEIDKVVEKHHAYISSERSFERNQRQYQSITVHIPSNRFDQFLAEISANIEDFDEREINSKDVTEEFVDLNARLKSKKELEDRFLQLLDKGNEIEDLLQVEEQIARVRSEIESLEGRLKYLRNRVGFSTLTIDYYLEQKPLQATFSGEFLEAFKRSWTGFIWLFVGLTTIWPLLVCGLLIGTVALFNHKRRMRKS
jgi:hypothetical protein